jgi:hypothetical protein
VRCPIAKDPGCTAAAKSQNSLIAFELMRNGRFSRTAAPFTKALSVKIVSRREKLLVALLYCVRPKWRFERWALIKLVHALLGLKIALLLIQSAPVMQRSLIERLHD